MRKILSATSAIVLLLVIHACSKSDNSSNSSARTVDNLSGSYTIVSITGYLGGQTIVLDTLLAPCERDNIIQLDNTMTAHFIDAGVLCVPPSDSTGTWSLSSNTDTIYVAGSASYIKTWDGKTLVLTNQETISGIPVPVTATTTLQKK